MINGTYVCKVFHFKAFFNNYSPELLVRSRSSSLHIKNIMLPPIRLHKFSLHTYMDKSHRTYRKKSSFEVIVANLQYLHCIVMEFLVQQKKSTLRVTKKEVHMVNRETIIFFLFTCNLYVLSASMTQIFTLVKLYKNAINLRDFHS